MKSIIRSRHARDVIFIGCCGAYCRTCRALILGHCRGCKMGYDDGRRNIANAKCKIKKCCFGTKRLETCAECPEYSRCSVLASLHGKKALECKKYRESLDFIRSEGYPEFVKKAKDWRRACGEL